MHFIRLYSKLGQIWFHDVFTLKCFVYDLPIKLYFEAQSSRMRSVFLASRLYSTDYLCVSYHKLSLCLFVTLYVFCHCCQALACSCGTYCMDKTQVSACGTLFLIESPDGDALGLHSSSLIPSRGKDYDPGVPLWCAFPEDRVVYVDPMWWC